MSEEEAVGCTGSVFWKKGCFQVTGLCERLEESMKFLIFSHKCREQAEEKQDQPHLLREEAEL